MDGWITVTCLLLLKLSTQMNDHEIVTFKTGHWPFLKSVGDVIVKYNWEFMLSSSVCSNWLGFWRLLSWHAVSSRGTQWILADWWWWNLCYKGFVAEWMTKHSLLDLVWCKYNLWSLWRSTFIGWTHITHITPDARDYLSQNYQSYIYH